MVKSSTKEKSLNKKIINEKEDIKKKKEEITDKSSFFVCFKDFKLAPWVVVFFFVLLFFCLSA